MECPSCTFQNMPGSGRCARCGAMLSFGAQAIDVHPPRASALGKSLQNWTWPVKRIVHLIGRRTAASFQSLAVDQMATHYDWGSIWRAIVPGWPHWHQGRKTEARWYLALYLIFGIPGLMGLASTFGALLAGMAFAVHAVSTATTFVPRFGGPQQRFAFTAVCAIAIAGLIYRPLGRAFSMVTTPLQVGYATADLDRGNVVWTSPAAQVHSGDLALYDLPPVNASGMIFLHRARVVNQGLRISRVIATENQKAVYKDNGWQVGGRTVEGAGPSSVQTPHLENSTVPPSCMLVDATDAIVGDLSTQHLDAPLGAILVPLDRLRGVVYLRTWPIWRIAVF
jgi:hypothetical protein